MNGHSSLFTIHYLFLPLVLSITQRITHGGLFYGILHLMKLPPRVVLGTDHAGYLLKEAVKKHLLSRKIDVVDCGCLSEESCDYPPIILQAASAVLEYDCPGIIFGGSGNGEAMVANKVTGIRCARCVSEWDSEMARKHNDANMMSLGGRVTPPDLACKMTDIFLTTDFEGGRHQKRLTLFPDTL